MRNAENREGGKIDKLMLGNLEKTSGGDTRIREEE